ncbi:MAG TPA: HAMP domain-containing sensor histidine kinase [Chitinophagaceae bacterium]|nr:HAMP domain-containing sensor histidine kinase [Chitinophagaceae bacterium]
MKLLSKLTLYITLSKTVIVILFIVLLPGLVKDVAFRYTNYSLKEQKKKVIDVINKNGIDYYFQGDSSYGSYTMLKEEYISLGRAGSNAPADTIETSRRIVENDTLTYRVLSHVFIYGGRSYILEIGKTIAAISQYNRPLQKVALYVLTGLIVFTLLVDLIFTRLLLRPLGVIIGTKLLNRKFPFKEELPAVNTSTTDFRFLDDSLIGLMSKIREAFEKEREFTSNASHELMTPIGILQNKMENLLDNDLPEALQEKVMTMMHTLGRLKKIVRSLLLISQIENDQFAKSPAVNIGLLVEEVVKDLEDRFEARGIRVKVDIEKDAAIHNVNRDLLFQLVYNLVNNAVRYNKENGEVLIGGQYKPDASYILQIKDSGIGIPGKDIAGIFDRFKKSTRTGEESYGLGLSIVKSIALYHNWEIKVVSEPGIGTIFSIVF